jgi:hypothetical protein
MSKTEKAIRDNFSGASNAGLRAALRQAAAQGSVLGLRATVALTISGRLGVEAVEAARVQDEAR